MGAVFNFKDTLEKVQVPVVTLNNNGKKFNFIVDTGSSTSAINKECLPDLEYTLFEATQTSIGVEGNPVECGMCGVVFTDDSNNKFKDIMTIVDMSAALDYIKETEGVELHGMLGSAFFTMYGCILDYNKKIIYTP